MVYCTLVVNLFFCYHGSLLGFFALNDEYHNGRRKASHPPAGLRNLEWVALSVWIYFTSYFQPYVVKLLVTI